MQTPLEDPFGDRSVRPPTSVGRPRRVETPRKVRDQSVPVRGRQISVLNNGPQSLAIGGQQGEEGPTEDTGEFEPEPKPDFSQSIEESLQNELNRRDLDSKDPSEALDDSFGQMLDEPENDLRSQSDRDRSGKDTPRSLLDDDRDEDEADDSKPREPTALDKSCDEFRYELLDNPIRNIALDISPPASPLRGQQLGLSRSWMDRSGNVIATGTMVDLRRGYVIIEGNGRQKLAFSRLSDSDLAAVAQYWQIPTICTVGNRGTVERNWIPQTTTWTAASLCHKPLYFENIQLERYGHSHGPFAQPVRSFAHFFVSFMTVPYQSAIHPANECQYALGYYRPGDCAPWLKDPVPISLSGLRRQGLITTGLWFIP